MYKLELKSSHEVIETVNVADVESIFYCKPTDPDILTVLMTNGKRLYCDEVCPVQEEPVSEDLEEAAYHNCIDRLSKESIEDFKAGAKWQKERLWKPADGDDLPEIDKDVIALTQPYPNDEHLRVVFAHRTNKYAKVWNSNLGEEQIVEIEGYDKGGWNIPNVKWWLDIELPKEIEP